MFKEDYALHEHWLAIEMNLTTLPQFSHFEELGGYTVEMNESTLNAVRKDHNVEFVEAERLVSIQRDAEYTFELDHWNESVLDYSQRQAPTHYKISTDHHAPYNLQMIGAGTKLPTPVEDGDGPYQFIENAGQGVDIYILDGGFKLNHRLFQGRAVNFPPDLGPKEDSLSAPSPSRMGIPGRHGTAVASIAGAKEVGVAPGATLLNVKVFRDGIGIGHESGVARTKLVTIALNAIAKKHVSSRESDTTGQFRGSVVNMSWGFNNPGDDGWSRLRWPTFAFACRRTRGKGVTLVSAAENKKKRLKSLPVPCVFDSVICVAQVDASYDTAEDTPWGPKIDFYAPGTNVKVLSETSRRDLSTSESGNSFAAPHVSGIAAIFTSWKGLATGGLKTYLYWNSIEGIVSPFTPTNDDGCAKSDEIIYNNLFVTTGIRGPESLKEPFKYGGAVRAAEIRKGKTISDKDWKKPPPDF